MKDLLDQLVEQSRMVGANESLVLWGGGNNSLKTTATDLLEQGVPMEDVQFLLGHADPRTTQLYDRRKRQVTRNIVERISI